MAFLTVLSSVFALMVNAPFSAGSIVIAALTAGKERIHFEAEIPFSAYWYAGRRGVIDTAPPSRTTAGDLFIVRKKHHADFARTSGAECVLVQRTGKWFMYRCPTAAPPMLTALSR